MYLTINELKKSKILDYIYNAVDIGKILKEYNSDNSDEPINSSYCNRLIEKLVNNIEYDGNYVTVYRKILTKILTRDNNINNPVGTSWAFNYESARVYLGLDDIFSKNLLQ